jgi:hypothetical protein
MKSVFLNLVLAAVLTSLTERAKADTIVLQTTGAHVVTETTTPDPYPPYPPYPPPQNVTYSISFSTPSINIQNGSEYFVFEYLAPRGIEYSLPYGGLLTIDGAFFTNSALGINSVVAGTISVSGLNAVDGYQLIFSGGVNGSDGFIYVDNSQINFFGPASFSGIQISIPIEGTGNNVNLGPENLNTPFTISSNSRIRAESVPEPSALSLLAIGLGGLAMMRRRRS